MLYILLPSCFVLHNKVDGACTSRLRSFRRKSFHLYKFRNTTFVDVCINFKQERAKVICAQKVRNMLLFSMSFITTSTIYTAVVRYVLLLLSSSFSLECFLVHLDLLLYIGAIMVLASTRAVVYAMTFLVSVYLCHYKLKKRSFGGSHRFMA